MNVDKGQARATYRNGYEERKIQFEENKKKKKNNDILPRKLWHHIA